MDEFVPVLLAFVLGTAIWRYTRGRTRLILSCLAVAVSGLTATTISGEYEESWLYLLLDLGEAAFGLSLGFVVAHRVLPLFGARAMEPKSRESERTPKAG